MGIFGSLGNNYLKDGPGVNKNAPSKKGLFLFFEIFIREFWSLIKLNLIFILFCIPIITIPAAIGAMTFVTTKMVRDQPNEPFSDFIEGFKKNWKQSCIAGLIFFLIFASITSSFLLGVTQQTSFFFAIAFLLNIIGGIFVINLYPMVIVIDVPLFAAFKNSLFLGFLCLNYSLPALLISEALLIACFALLPVSLPILLGIVFSLINFIASFAAWAGIKKYVVTTTGNKSPAQSRCGLLCGECDFVEEFGCKGCMNISQPFWGDCPVKTCCEEKKHEHCGECDNLPCDLINKMAYDLEQGDNGKRIEQCKAWRL